jgi:hypothetical protein
MYLIKKIDVVKNKEKNLHVGKSEINMAKRGTYNTDPNLARHWWCHNDLFNHHWLTRSSCNRRYIVLK